MDFIFRIVNEIMYSSGNEDKKVDISKTVFNKLGGFTEDLDEYTNPWDFIHILLYHYFKSGQEDMCRFIIVSSKTITEDLKNNDEGHSLLYSLLSDCHNFTEDPKEYSSSINLIKFILDEGIKSGLTIGYNINDYDFSAHKEYLEECKEITEHLRSFGVNLDFLTEE